MLSGTLKTAHNRTTSYLHTCKSRQSQLVSHAVLWEIKCCRGGADTRVCPSKGWNTETIWVSEILLGLKPEHCYGMLKISYLVLLSH